MIRLVLVALLWAATNAIPLMTPSSAAAEPGGASGSDGDYYQQITTGRHPLTVWNFPLLVSQGHKACQLMGDGASTLDAVDVIMTEGPYSAEDAMSIVDAAGYVYCPSDYAAAQSVKALPRT